MLSNAPQPLVTQDISSPSAIPTRLIRPIGAYALHGLASTGDALWAIDAIRGYILRINPANDDAQVVNSYTVQSFIDATGLAVADGRVWFTRDHEVYWCNQDDFVPHLFARLPYPVNGVAVYQSTVYLTCQKSGYIHIYDMDSARLITRFPAPGVGIENITMCGEELWLCDRLEQTVYCLDRATGEIQLKILTPFQEPSGITFHSNPDGEGEVLYLAYAQEEAYIRDNPNIEPPHELTYRDRTYIHSLTFRHLPEQHYTLSNGYLVEMSYVEEISPLESVEIPSLEWRIALPAETARQKLLRVESVGMPFVEERQDGQRVALFKFDKLTPHEGRLFGWKALLEMRGIKYHLTFDDVDKIPPLSLEMQSRYLVDDDDLAMDTPTIREAARKAVGTETNILRKVLKIRNYVYDRLSYAIKPRIDTPDVALARGTGSCGEYVGVLLALLRLNGIACRTVGRYKCPQKADYQQIPLEPDFNHVWIEFYIPGLGWLPMESNVDDANEGGPYPTRFFLGLPWWHVEMAKGIPFEKIAYPGKEKAELSIGDLALNHVRFRILGELPPL
jgi:transglutaminase-like putative cysteine protease